MAKKVRQNPVAVEETKFQFPVFDEKGFIAHELELTYGMAMAVVWAIVAGVLAAGVGTFLARSEGSTVGISAAVGAGLVVILTSFVVFPQLRSSVATYTKSDWAGLVALEIFGWIGIWFLLGSFLA